VRCTTFLVLSSRTAQLFALEQGHLRTQPVRDVARRAHRPALTGRGSRKAPADLERGVDRPVVLQLHTHDSRCYFDGCAQEPVLVGVAWLGDTGVEGVSRAASDATADRDHAGPGHRQGVDGGRPCRQLDYPLGTT
jgi:hypothetical protein